MQAYPPAYILPMTPELFILLPLTFVAAMLNASVGGGGLVLIPGLLTLYPSVSPASLLATEKLASVVGQATAAQQYARRMTLPWRLVLTTAALAFCGAHLGARAIAVLPGVSFRFHARHRLRQGGQHGHQSWRPGLLHPGRPCAF